MADNSPNKETGNPEGSSSPKKSNRPDPHALAIAEQPKTPYTPTR